MTIAAALMLPPLSWGDGDDQAELAKKLQNPVASLISVPIQNNWDFGIGPANAMQYTANVQPVIPFSLNPEWNLIIRTIVPVIYAESPLKGGKAKYGLGDILQSFFFAPAQPLGGWVLAAGPALHYPSASEDALGGEKWGAGPTFVVLQQRSGFTYGALANHLWSFAGNSRRSDLNASFVQPFFSYTTKTHTTLGVSTESTYDWESDQWTIPVNGTLSQLLKLGGRPIQLSVGGRYYAEAPRGGPDWGLRFVVTLLFQK